MPDALETAARDPSAVAQIAAAYACDRAGDEVLAIVYYDRAWALGVPEPMLPDFLVGYGSTLRNVGRASEAVAILESGVQCFPDFPPLRAFWALALHSTGQSAQAVAVLLDLGLHARLFAPYDQALTEYRDELRC